jgi:riboflavin kinase/FMN adenylyltransferase
MQIHRNYYELAKTAQNTVAALGNFDGVHLGHVAILNKAQEIASSKNLPSAVITFNPHPATVLNKAKSNLLILPLRNKIQLLQQRGLDHFFLFNFSKAFSALPAQSFIENILINKLKIQHIVVGVGFLFGYNRSGNAGMMREFGIDVTEVELITQNKMICNSTNIRDFLSQGQMDKARQLLGYPYFIEGRVQKGAGRGKKIDVPTANIMLQDLHRPAFGVYKVRLYLENKQYEAVANLGKRPSFAYDSELLEVHIFDFNRDIYGKRIKVELLEFIRPERKFDNIEELAVQIQQDIQIAKGEAPCIKKY